MLRKVQRNVYPSNSVPGRGIRWEWYGDVKWMAYDIPTSEVIEKQKSSGSDVLDLTNTPVAIPNVLNFSLMEQINKRTGFRRNVRRLKSQSYPLDTNTLNVVGASPTRGPNVSATLNGHMVSSHTKALKTTAAPRKGIESASMAKKTKTAKVEHSQGIEYFDLEISKSDQYLISSYQFLQFKSITKKTGVKTKHRCK